MPQHSAAIARELVRRGATAPGGQVLGWEYCCWNCGLAVLAWLIAEAGLPESVRLLRADS
jgi:hypothetical protein